MQFDVKIGVNPISWFNDDLTSLGAETPLSVALSEGQEIGFKGFELGNKFPKDKAELKATLDQYGFECVSGWYSGFLGHDSVEAEIDRVAPYLDKMLYNNSHVMVYGECAGTIQGDRSKPLYMRPKFRNDDEWQTYADKLTRFADWLLARGMRLGYHHHMGAFVETPADVDTLMRLTGDSVGLLFDTGHMTFAGGDALTELKKHIHRVCHVHCKDVRPHVIKLARNRNWAFLDAVLNGAFTVPGDGAINFAPILQTLAEHGYKGWLVIEAEQDPVVAPSYQYVKKGFTTLDQLVKHIQGQPS